MPIPITATLVDRIFQENEKGKELLFVDALPILMTKAHVITFFRWSYLEHHPYTKSAGFDSELSVEVILFVLNYICSHSFQNNHKTSLSYIFKTLITKYVK